MKEDTFLGEIEDTLFIPLAARIYVSEKFPNFFYDEKAISLKKYMTINNSEEKSTEYFHMANVCRQYVIDKKIKKFIENNNKSNIVFLGAGLETAYNRIKNKTATFYQLDLDNIINKRKTFLDIGENEILISGDMFAMNWIHKIIDNSLPTLIVAAGVFEYFDENKIIEMLEKIKKTFKKMELVFDATNLNGIKVANRYLKKIGNKNITMNFYVNNPEKFAEKIKMQLIDVEGFFLDALKNCKGLKLRTKIYMYFADKLHRTMVIHIKNYE